MFNQYLTLRPQHQQCNKIPNLKSGPTSTYKKKHVTRKNKTHKYLHPVTYQSMTPMTHDESTHISGYSWLSARSHVEATFKQKGWDFTFN